MVVQVEGRPETLRKDGHLGMREDGGRMEFLTIPSGAGRQDTRKGGLQLPLCEPALL